MRESDVQRKHENIGAGGAETPADLEELKSLEDLLRSFSETQEQYARKQYRMAKFTAVCSLFILAAVLAACLTLIPRANRILHNTEVVMEDVRTVTSELRHADLTQMIDDMDSLVGLSEQSVQSALEKINAIDISSLNKAIRDLSSIVNPLARLFGGGR